MPPREWSYGDGEEEGEDLPVRDRTYESFGQQGYAMPDHATRGGAPHGVERIELGERVEAPRPPAPRKLRRSDERIHDDVCAVLADDPWVDAGDLEVLVDDGEVTLAGTVEDRMQRERAVYLTESVRGVVEVVSRVRVRPEERGDAPRRP